MLVRFARLMYHRRRTVVAVWIVALVAVSLAGSAWGGDDSVDYTTPGSDSAEAQELLASQFPEYSGDSVQLLFQAPAGVDDAAIAEQIDAVHREAAAVPHVVDVRTAAISPDGTIALSTVQLDATTEKVPVATVEEIIAIADTSTGDGLTVEAGGSAVQVAESSEAGSEQIGMVAALLILLVAFGSVLAAGLPVLVALLGIGVTLGVVELMKHLFMVPDWATNLVMMISIGIGIDYALFILTRYRTALAGGQDPEDAVITALSTAGRAVLFAGGTVVISLLGLSAMGMEYLYGTAAVTVTGVFIVLLASITLLPAILGFAGHGIDRLRVPFVRGDRGDDGMWARWSRVVQRRPVVTGAVALVVLVGLAAPFGGMRFGYPDAGTGPDHLTSRRAYDLAAEAFGPGANGPLVLAVEVNGDADLVYELGAALAETPGVAAVAPPQHNATGEAAVLLVTPATGPQDEATEQLIRDLRDGVVPSVTAGSPAQVHVGGATAAFLDESSYMGGRLPVFIGAVLALSFLLLLVVFRSVLVAVKAAIMNLLSIGAAYGVMAIALSGGWFGELIGVHEATPIPAWAPMMMFALLFGLSMDYEVFLLSRIREEYLRTGDNASSVAHGMARTGRVITAAAAIMVTVFGAFMLGDMVLMKVIGLGMATAILVDATIVRMVLVPSTMELLGDRNWWLPRWLDRFIPTVDLEGPAGDAPAARPTVVHPEAAPVDEPQPVGELVGAMRGAPAGGGR
jgi:putative drug exporter of the RND superfamily